MASSSRAVVRFNELVQLLESGGFRLAKEKGSVRYYSKTGHDRLIRIDYHGAKEVPKGTCEAILKAAGLRQGNKVIDLTYSLVIEATEDPTFFGFYSPELEGFTGVGHSIEDCLYQARWGMQEHLALLKEQGLPIPPMNPNPTVVIQNQQSTTAAR